VRDDEVGFLVLGEVMNRVIPIAAILLILSSTQLSRAAVVYDNLGTPANYTNDGFASFGLYQGTYYEEGMQFTPSQTIQLSTLSVALGLAFVNGQTHTGLVEVQLLSDANNQFGSVLETFTSTTNPVSTGSLFTFTSVATPTLTFGSKYWIVLSAAPQSNLYGAWYFAETNQPGNVLTAGAAVGGTPTYIERTRGYQSEVIGSIPGDLNNDGVINQADLDIITANNGKTISGGVSVGDLNGDGVVNQDDWALFDYDVAQYDVANPVVPAPEPGALGLVGAMVVAFRYRRKH
jgi:hypothetical protein